MSTPNEDQLNRAALHALNALDGPEAEAYRRLLADEGADAQAARADVAAMQRTAAQLGTAVPPVAPPPTIKAALFARIQTESPRTAPALPGFTFIREAEGTWVEPHPGMRLKVLHVDPITHRTTAIAKFAPGYRHAPHRHAQTEELFVLEGGCLCQGQALFPGDYHRSETDSIHGETTTQDGCTLLIMFSPRNETVGSLSARISSVTVSLLFRVSAWFARVAETLARRQ